MKKGITISTLAIVVAVMLITATTASVVGVKSINTANFEDYKSKLRRMADAVLEYVDTNKNLPTTGEVITTDNLSDNFIYELMANGDIYSKLYVVDLELLDISVNIGDGTTQNEDVFVVSEDTNNVYYLKGKTYKGTTYYSMLGQKGVGTGEIIEATSVTITGPTEVMIDNSIQLVAKIAPDNATNKIVKWSTSDKSIAEVNKTGKVTGLSEGTVTITATVSGTNVDVTASYEVTVEKSVVRFTLIGDEVLHTMPAGSLWLDFLEGYSLVTNCTNCDHWGLGWYADLNAFVCPKCEYVGAILKDAEWNVLTSNDVIVDGDYHFEYYYYNYGN